ncbi:B-cell CLL lymphoma 9 isoform X2 [Pelobates cultripes]|uniref:B-cell CLL lymphoma 9 isoform X2 n=2 Tax=Pelobates cultripes TaxID=61616 RepID=A0AAD1TBK9_PELCU|nr:B-cell CLL lymphoma 9 isoform X2 [Pelobates cultripes]
MHPESKLANHGKASNNGGQSQPPNVSQAPKGSGLLGPKTNHMSPNSVGLKNAQNQGSNHGKGQRESSGEVGEQRDPGTPSREPEPKGELPSRSKRRCVLERKQPYSGDEWCSGPESEEDEKALVASHNCNAGDSVTSASTLPGSASLPGLNDSSSSSTPHGVGPNHRGDGGSLVGSSKPPSQFVYVFTTNLANTAAEAVLKGHADSILLYHQQNVPRAKLDEATLQKPSSDSEGGVVVPGSSIPPSAPSKPANQPTPASGHAPPAALQETTSDEVKRELTPNPLGNGSSRPASSHSNPPLPSSGGLPEEKAELGDTIQGNGGTINQEGLSREQLEHRERSLQTLRDIERLLLRTGSASEPFSKHSQSPGEAVPPSNLPAPPVNPPTPMKKYEEPLQSMITQTQSLGAPGMEQDMGGPQPGPDMGHQMSLMMQRLGQDSLTPEQAAWRKLQEEYYAEKRRKEEHMSIHGRPAPDMMLRGPPPPYHSKPGEQWIGNRIPGTLEGQEPMPLRGGGITFQGPRFTGRYGPMQNIPMDMGILQRPNRWPEEMSPMGGGQGGFPQGGMSYPGGSPGEVERFLNPRAREELLRQQLIEKRPTSMQRQLAMPTGQGIEMERVLISHRQGEHSVFPGDGIAGGHAMGMDFGNSRAMLSPSINQQGVRREQDPTIGGGGNLNMNMSVNMNMNLNLQMTPHQQMLLSQKMRSGGELMGPQGEIGSEELMRAVQSQNGSGMTGDSQKMLIPAQFPQGQPGFPPGQSQFPNMQQEMSMDMFGPEHSSVGGTTRLSHMPMPSVPGGNSSGLGPIHSRGLGRRPTELTINVNQIGSPIMSHLKSPTVRQVNSPVVSSPSANMKSPENQVAQMAGLPPSNHQASLKSPQMLGSSISGRSPSTSPGRLKSPHMNVPSPGWAPSPKATMPSPGIPPGKQGIGINSGTSIGVMEQGGAPSQNPLSLMMSQMSKYAMPSSTPLYHNAIKTIATSDDELLPERVLLPPGSQQGPGMNAPISLHLNLSSSQSPMGNITLPGQPPLSHEHPSSLLASPGPPMHPPIGPAMQNPLMMPSMNQEPCCPGPGPQMMSSNQLVFPPRLQPGPPHNQGVHQSGSGSSMQQHFPDDVHHQPRLPHRMSDPYGPSLPSILSDPDLGDVIRPSASGIPEFDLSRIMPSEKPSSTLQYFPKGGSQNPKPHPTNMHLLSLQNMMVEQHSGRLGPSLPGPQRSLGVPPMPSMGRTGMAPPPQMGQQNFMLMKQRSVSGEMFPQNAHMLSPQGALGGHLTGQQSMMVGHQMRQRSVSLDTYIPGPGHLPF